MSNFTPPDQYPAPKKKVAVLHHNDADGFGAAFSIWKALNTTCELLFIKVQYGQEPPYEELRNFEPGEVYIVDFSYDFNTSIELWSEFKNLFIADHHKTAEPVLRALEAVTWTEEGYTLYTNFNLEMSGAVLTWMMFNEDIDSIPEILLYVQDRDLWKFELENSKEINAFIATMPEDFHVWDDFYMPEAYDSGKAILRFQATQIEKRLKDVRVRTFVTRKPEYKPYDTLPDQWEVPFVNASENISELGHAMNEAYPDAPFSVSYCDRADGKRSYSLRSQGGFDVSTVAKAFGGGGHPGAAGFTFDAPDII